MPRRRPPLEPLRVAGTTRQSENPNSLSSRRLFAPSKSLNLNSLQGKSNAINSMMGGLVGSYAGGDIQQRNLAATQFYEMQRLNQQAMNAARMGALNTIMSGAYGNATDFQGGAGILSRVTSPYYYEPTTPYPGMGSGGGGASGFGNGMPSGFGMKDLFGGGGQSGSAAGVGGGGGQSGATPNTSSNGFYNGWGGVANNTAGSVYDNYQPSGGGAYAGSDFTTAGGVTPGLFTNTAYTVSQ